MAQLYMLKHRGFPGRMPGSDAQFTIRRPATKGVTPLKARERFKDRRAIDRKADELFLTALWQYFGAEPFERGNLDAGRINWLFDREILAGEDPFEDSSYESMLKLDTDVIRRNFPQINLDGEE
jgi:hypothetical protein